MPRWLIVLSLCFLPGPALAGETGSPLLEIRGPQVAGGLLLGRTLPGTEVRFAGETVPVSDQGQFLFGVDRDASGVRELRLELPSGRVLTRRLPIQQRTYGTQHIDGLPSYLVNPGKEFLERIRREAARAKEVRQQVSSRLAFDGTFTWPVGGQITGVYGTARVLNGEPRQPHLGVDIAAPDGTPVRAPAPGRVALAHEGMFFSGKTLFLDHGHGLHSSYLHLSEIRVQPGERVERGEIIALVGGTGRATGPHLDWRASWLGNRLDPALLPGIRRDGGGLALSSGDRIATDVAREDGGKR
jgi:hypothetical protein